MPFFKDCTKEDLYSLLEKYCVTFSEKTRCRIYINSVVLEEIIRRGRKTVVLFDLEDDDINHYKEAAILCYLIRKLKPCRVVSPINYLETFKLVNERITKAMEAKLVAAEERSQNAIQYPINEKLALDIAQDFVIQAQLEILKSEITEGSPTHADFKEQMLRNSDQYAKCVEGMQWSFRYFNHSPIGISNMLETAFNTTFG